MCYGVCVWEGGGGDKIPIVLQEGLLHQTDSVRRKLAFLLFSLFSSDLTLLKVLQN